MFFRLRLNADQRTASSANERRMVECNQVRQSSLRNDQDRFQTTRVRRDRDQLVPCWEQFEVMHSVRPICPAPILRHGPRAAPLGVRRPRQRKVLRVHSHALVRRQPLQRLARRHASPAIGPSVRQRLGVEHGQVGHLSRGPRRRSTECGCPTE